MGVGVYGRKDFWKRYVFSLEWKSEGAMDDDSVHTEWDEGKDDWLDDCDKLYTDCPTECALHVLRNQSSGSLNFHRLKFAASRHTATCTQIYDVYTCYSGIVLKYSNQLNQMMAEMQL